MDKVNFSLIVFHAVSNYVAEFAIPNISSFISK